MGTTLTGTTPQDTYDSLIKVTDNGPLSSTVKYLTDGLGNDSALAVSTARVGIGTTSNYSFNDDAKLAVANTSGNSTISIVSSTSGIGYLAFADGTSGTDRYTGSINYNHSTNAMTLHTNAGNEQMRITSAGNVGIGTTSPSVRLHVKGTAETGSVLRLEPATSTTIYSQVVGNNGDIQIEADPLNNEGSSAIKLSVDGSERVRITSSGNVGIGTTAPTVRLQVRQDVPASTSLAPTLIRLYNESDGGAAISMDNGVGGKGAFAFSAESTGGGTDDIALIFSNSFNGSALTERMRISSTGSVGIGTSSPAQKLDVNGSVRANGGSYDPTTSAWVNAAFTTAVSASPYGGGVSIIDGTAGWTQYGIGSGANLVFAYGTTSGGTTPYLTLNNSGYLRLAAGGIQFNGDTAAANALDDYEEGTWTPSLTFNGGGIGISYSSQGGKYTKIGNVVHYSFRFTLTSKGSSTGVVRIEGLPFTVGNTNTADFTGGSIGAIENITFSTFPIALCIANTNYLVMEEGTSGGVLTSLTNADMTDTSTLRVTGFYYV